MHPFDFKFRVWKLFKLLNIVSPSRKFFPSGGIRNLHFQLPFPEDISEVDLWWECENPSHINGILIVEYKIGLLIVKNDYPWFHFVTVSIHLAPCEKIQGCSSMIFCISREWSILNYENVEFQMDFYNAAVLKVASPGIE